MMLLSITAISAQEEEEATATPRPPIDITIWWPDSFARVGDSNINPLLIAQTNAFLAQTDENVRFEHRLKSVGQTGGIMSTLRSASIAARGALPTLTLVRRQDLLTAQAAGYIHPMEDFSMRLQNELGNTLQIGQISDELYGIPYLVDLQHMVYRPSEGVDYSSWTFDAVLERGEPFLFVAGRPNSLNDVLALQYIESGGLPTFSDELIASEAALTTVFEFYETATDRQMITGAALNILQVEGYLGDFVNGTINSAVFNSSRFLSLYAEDDSLAIAPIPSETGAPISFMNGWMWVLVTQDADERDVALDYLVWLLDSERLSAVGQAVRMVPARESAINLGLANDAPSSLYINLLNNAILPLSERRIGRIGREIQTQFSSILTLERNASQATEAVLNLDE
ncbi:MAG: extracellular solute-binding protein [Anaerolineae bacterium]